MSDLEAVRKAHESELLAIPGVVGVGIVDGVLGAPAIGVYVTHAGIASAVPKTLDGVEVIVEVSGEIDALRPPDRIRPTGDASAEPRARDGGRRRTRR